MAHGAGERHMQGPLRPEIMADLGLVAVAQGHASHAGEDAPVLDISDLVEIHPSRCQTAAVKHGDQVGLTGAVTAGHHGHLKGPIAAAAQQPIGDPEGWQSGAQQHHATAGWEYQFIEEVAIQLVAQHLHGGGVARTGVPGAGAKGLHPHQIVGQIGSFKTVAHGAPLELNRHRSVAGVDQNHPEGEFGAALIGSDLTAIGGEIFVVHVQAEFTVEGVFSIGQGHTVLCGVAEPRYCGDQDAGPLHLLRLVGVENRYAIEAAVEGPGPLPGHQGHVGMGWLGGERGGEANHHTGKGSKHGDWTQ